MPSPEVAGRHLSHTLNSPAFSCVGMEWVAGVGRGVTAFTMQCEKVSVVAYFVNYGDDTINAQNTPTQHNVHAFYIKETGQCAFNRVKPRSNRRCPPGPGPDRRSSWPGASSGSEDRTPVLEIWRQGRCEGCLRDAVIELCCCKFLDSAEFGHGSACGRSGLPLPRRAVAKFFHSQVMHRERSVCHPPSAMRCLHASTLGRRGGESQRGCSPSAQRYI